MSEFKLRYSRPESDTLLDLMRRKEFASSGGVNGQQAAYDKFTHTAAQLYGLSQDGDLAQILARIAVHYGHGLTQETVALYDDLLDLLDCDRKTHVRN